MGRISRLLNRRARKPKHGLLCDCRRCDHVDSRMLEYVGKKGSD